MHMTVITTVLSITHNTSTTCFGQYYFGHHQIGYNYRIKRHNIQSESLARGPKLLSMYTIEQRGFLVRKYWPIGSFKARQTAFRTEFGERRAPSKCCIQKLVKKLETKGSRSNAC